MSRWDGVATLEEARRAVWGENDADYDERAKVCLDLIEPYLYLKSGDTVLDIGCGIGRLAIPLALRRPECRVLGYDTSQTMLNFARREAGDVIPNVAWVHGGSLPRCDAAYSVVTFQHLDPATVSSYLRQLGECLARGGTFLFQTVRGDYHVEDDHRYDPDEVSAVCETNGLRVVTVEHGLLYEEWTWIACERIEE